jgi:hypothetical protein
MDNGAKVEAPPFRVWEEVTILVTDLTTETYIGTHVHRYVL